MVASVGIDVGKKHCQVALRRTGGEYLEKSFDNSRESIANCVDFFNARGVSKETPLVLESTGDYHLLFTMALKDTYHYGSVKVINGILTKKYTGANIRKIKTDPVDAKILAEIGEREKLLSIRTRTLRLRSLWSLRPYFGLFEHFVLNYNRPKQNLRGITVCLNAHKNQLKKVRGCGVTRQYV